MLVAAILKEFVSKGNPNQSELSFIHSISKVSTFEAAWIISVKGKASIPSAKGILKLYLPEDISLHSFPQEVRQTHLLCGIR